MRLTAFKSSFDVILSFTIAIYNRGHAWRSDLSLILVFHGVREEVYRRVEREDVFLFWKERKTTIMKTGKLGRVVYRIFIILFTNNIKELSSIFSFFACFLKKIYGSFIRGLFFTKLFSAVYKGFF